MQYNITYREKDKGIQYIISYKDYEGKWKQKSKQGYKKKADAKAAAQKEVRTLQREMEQKVNLNKEYKGITFKQFSEMFIKHEKLYKEQNTIVLFSTTFKAFKDLDNIAIDKINNMNIQGCVDDLVKAGYKNTTIKLYLSKINTAFKYAINQLKIIPSNPVQSISVPKDKSISEKRALTKEELNALLNSLKNRKHYMISLIAAECGLRIGEILGLTWDDIDRKTCIMTIHQQWKMKKDGIMGFGELKSKNSYRQIPIPPKVMAELKKYENEYPINIDKRLFNYNSQRTVSSELIYSYRNAGFDISVHELRHTYATMLIANGVDFKTVAKLMGHNVEQTIKTYSHVTEDMLNNASNIINNIF